MRLHFPQLVFKKSPNTLFKCQLAWHIRYLQESFQYYITIKKKNVLGRMRKHLSPERTGKSESYQISQHPEDISLSLLSRSMNFNGGVWGPRDKNKAKLGRKSSSSLKSDPITLENRKVPLFQEIQWYNGICSLGSYYIYICIYIYIYIKISLNID